MLKIEMTDTGYAIAKRARSAIGSQVIEMLKEILLAEISGDIKLESITTIMKGYNEYV